MDPADAELLRRLQGCATQWGNSGVCVAARPHRRRPALLRVLNGEFSVAAGQMQYGDGPNSVTPGCGLARITVILKSSRMTAGVAACCACQSSRRWWTGAAAP